ncbi:Tad domain-containing protein [Ferrimonas balearica]|uniref:Tad domain-containing protein n=1 Tax=Ferrimonas balearica TaxID=44012 RepID=UPI001C9A2045|nr:Tad domain-containing protein [Ferrimonas balearica]MBY5992035.1 Tad domain-containing protein [Ferrimonas balearica]
MKGSICCQRHRQKGAIIVVITVAMFAILAMGALALDGGHLILSKNRLQNATDAAALSAAVTVERGGTHAQARQDGLATLASALGATDFGELNAGVDMSTMDYSLNGVTAQITVEFSFQPDPFTPVSDPSAEYARVTVDNVSLASYLAQVFNFDKRVSASAVAGPSTSTPYCSTDVLPMMVCAESLTESNFGYPMNQFMAMKISSGEPTEVGPGNFQLIRLGDNTGAADIRRAMAGESDSDGFCFGFDGPNATEMVETEPGNTTGPVAQGLNTRMGKWQGGQIDSTDHPPDHDICVGDRLDVNDSGEVTNLAGEVLPPPVETVAGDYYANPGDYYSGYYHHGHYNSVAGHSCPGTFTENTNHGVASRQLRREYSIVVADCGAGDNSGQTGVPFVGFACFYMLQDVTQKGNESYVIGEFLGDCTNDAGGVSETPDTTSGPYRIVLYHDPVSKDS